MTSTPAIEASAAPATVRIDGVDFPVGTSIRWEHLHYCLSQFEDRDYDLDKLPKSSANATDEREGLVTAVFLGNAAAVEELDSKGGEWDSASIFRIVTDEGITVWMTRVIGGGRWGETEHVEVFLDEAAARLDYDGFHIRPFYGSSLLREEVYSEFDYCGQCTDCWAMDTGDIEAALADALVCRGLSIADLDRPLHRNVVDDDDF